MDLSRTNARTNSHNVITICVHSRFVSSGHNSLKKPQGGASGGGWLSGVFQDAAFVGWNRCDTRT